MMASPVLAQEAGDLPVPMSRPEASSIEAKPAADAEPKLRDFACEKRLTEKGVSFGVGESIDGGGSCGVAYPITIDELPGGIKVTPETQMQCRVGEALADWVEGSVLPAAQIFENKKLVGLTNASTYVCRTRNNQEGAKLSEHAFGNAIDISAFVFDDGSRLSVSPRDRTGSAEEAFQKAVRFGACLHFTTVLGPGSDATHEDHFHFDLAERRGGYRLCRFPG